MIDLPTILGALAFGAAGALALKYRRLGLIDRRRAAMEEGRQRRRLEALAPLDPLDPRWPIVVALEHRERRRSSGGTQGPDRTLVSDGVELWIAPDGTPPDSPAWERVGQAEHFSATPIAETPTRSMDVGSDSYSVGSDGGGSWSADAGS